MTIMPSVEGQCELSIKQAVNIDLVDQEQSNRIKADTKFYFVSISDFFIIINEKSKCIGELFIPSYTGYEQFQDSVRFNFFFRVRDSTGYDVILRPPERLRKRFFDKIRSIGEMIDNLNKQSQNIDPIEEKFECKLKGKPDQAVNILIEDNFINIFDVKQHIYLDKIDLSEPDVYVDGFHGFDDPPEAPTVYLYANNQLRQTLEFGEKHLDDAQRFMKTVARGSAKYCDNSHHSLIKNDLEIKNNEYQNDSNDVDFNSKLNKKSSFSGLNEFYEEPKHTKFPQGAKQKLKNSLRNQLKVKKAQFEQSKKDLRDLHAAQKQISIQQAQQQQPQAQLQAQLQNQTESKILTDDNGILQEPQSQLLQNADFYVETDSQELKESSEMFDLDQQTLSQQKPMSLLPRQKSTILLNDSIVEKANSQPFELRQSASTPSGFQQSKPPLPFPSQQQQLSNQKKKFSPLPYQKVKSQQYQQQQQQQLSPISQKSNLSANNMQSVNQQPPLPQQSPNISPNLKSSSNQQQSTANSQQLQSETRRKTQRYTSIGSHKKNLSFFKEEAEEEVETNYDEVIEMKEDDSEKIKIMVKSYLLLNYRKNYLKDTPDLEMTPYNENSNSDVVYKDEIITYSDERAISTQEINDFIEKAMREFQEQRVHLSTFRKLAEGLVTKKFEYKISNDSDDFIDLDFDSDYDDTEEVVEEFNSDYFKFGEEKNNHHITIVNNDEKFISESDENENINKPNDSNIISTSNSVTFESDNKSIIGDDEKSRSNSDHQMNDDESETNNNSNESSDDDKSETTNKKSKSEKNENDEASSADGDESEAENSDNENSDDDKSKATSKKSKSEKNENGKASSADDEESEEENSDNENSDDDKSKAASKKSRSEKNENDEASSADGDESEAKNSDNENSDDDKSKTSKKIDNKSKSSDISNANASEKESESTKSSTKNSSRSNNNNNNSDDDDYYENDQLSSAPNTTDTEHDDTDDFVSNLGMKLVEYIQKEVEKKFDIDDMILKLVIDKILKKGKKDILTNFLIKACKFKILHYFFIVIYNINCRPIFQKEEFLNDFNGTCFVDDNIIKTIISSLATNNNNEMYVY